MKHTTECIMKMKTICVKLQDALYADEVMDGQSKKLLIYYVTALQTQLDNITGYILEER